MSTPLTRYNFIVYLLGITRLRSKLNAFLIGFKVTFVKLSMLGYLHWIGTLVLSRENVYQCIS